MMTHIDHAELTLGAITPIPCVFAVDCVANAGFDYIVFDLEHSAYSEYELAHHITHAKHRNLTTLVRIHKADLPRATKFLDLGADGLMVPTVSSAQEAQEILELIQYPPEGIRGFATISPSAQYGGLSKSHILESARKNILLVAMIEDSLGVHNAQEIVAVEGVTAVFVGKADLAVNLPGISADELNSLEEAVRVAASHAEKTFIKTDTAPSSGESRSATLVNIVRLLNENLSSIAHV